ncbi:ParB-like chromosome segregation protein Spo0J [Streptomyces atratus]|uniref:hypothetical protein n=1 Tax=Streptomyces atratus TaxID=1893 RepID=UPI0033912D54
MLDDDLGSNPDEILESALVANIHRHDLDHLDEAKESGEESAALMRRVGKMKAEEQEEHLRHLKEKEAQEAADKKARTQQRVASSRKQPPQTPPVENSPSEEPSGPAANPAPSPDHYAVINESASDETVGNDLPKPREEAGTVSRLPSRDPEALSELIIAELDVPTRRKLTELLVDYKIEETERMRAEQASAAAEK